MLFPFKNLWKFYNNLSAYNKNLQKKHWNSYTKPEEKTLEFYLMFTTRWQRIDGTVILGALPTVSSVPALVQEGILFYLFF